MSQKKTPISHTALIEARIKAMQDKLAELEAADETQTKARPKRSEAEDFAVSLHAECCHLCADGDAARLTCPWHHATENIDWDDPAFSAWLRRAERLLTTLNMKNASVKA
jgi:hypothetical protein